MITEAIILAGGLGTRLRSVVADVPKCMAPVSGKPFLAYLINALQNQGIEKFIFSLGYKSEIILQYLANEFPNLNTQIVVEKEPLGTGGAIRLACEKVAGDDVLIFNGDTFFDINLKTFSAFHHTQNAACSIALKTMQQFDRYGSVEISEEHIVTAFNEKKFLQNGIINAGIYALKVKPFLKFDFPAIFSFEKMYLEKNTVTHKIYGKQFADFFIDIGIPEDYDKAQIQMPVFYKKYFPKLSKSSGYTLFLDRDGVINHEQKDGYINHWNEFKFYDGVLEAIKIFAAKFDHIFIVTNQRGVGRGITNEEDLKLIHRNMAETIICAGGNIDKVYYCTDIEDSSPNRKPNTGMALQAKKEFEQIDFKKSVMVGNTASDMQFGRNIGAYTVFLTTTRPEEKDNNRQLIDQFFPDLIAYAKFLS